MNAGGCGVDGLAGEFIGGFANLGEDEDPGAGRLAAEEVEGFEAELSVGIQTGEPYRDSNTNGAESQFVLPEITGFGEWPSAE